MRYRENKKTTTNPFVSLVPYIENDSKLHFEDIVDFFDNKVEESQDSDDEDGTENTESVSENESSANKNGNLVEKVNLNYVEKYILKMFSLGVKFDGEIRQDNLLLCAKGNIYCEKCKASLLSVDQPLSILEQYGGVFMQQHIVEEPLFKTIGIATKNNLLNLINNENFDMTTVQKCRFSADRDHCRQLFFATSLDAAKTYEE